MLLTPVVLLCVSTCEANPNSKPQAIAVQGLKWRRGGYATISRKLAEMPCNLRGGVDWAAQCHGVRCIQKYRLAENVVMFMRLLCVVSISILLSGIASSTVRADVALVSESGNFLGGHFGDQTVGWVFHLNTEVTLNRLGVEDSGQDGFVNAHDVGLWTASGTLLASATLPAGTSGSLFGNFRYVDVPSMALPVADYVIGTYYPTPADDFIQDVPLFQTHPYVEYIRRAGTGPGFVFPTIIPGNGNGNWFSSNFQFNLVPEPSSVALLGMGGLAMLGCVIRRHRRVNQSLTHREESGK